jgi:PLP dependent protein
MGLHELEEIRVRIAAAERDSGRQPGEVTLVAVSKTFGDDAIIPILDAGHRVFGENRVQEAMAKWPRLRERYSGIELHLVGPLQTNKAADAVALFDCIESLDRPRLAGILAKEMQRQSRRPMLFVQVNTGEEPQKAGVAPDETDWFVAECRTAHGLSIAGLMCIPPEHEEAALHFALLEKIARRNEITKLSMGMSADFEKAIRFGATHVRIGSAIFGARAQA